jgi:hypothetical protein
MIMLMVRMRMNENDGMGTWKGNIEGERSID